MSQKKQLEGFGPSIHFGIDEDVYRADPALSYSGMKVLLDSELEFWLLSHMNPYRKEMEPTDSMKKGTWFHCLLLEPELFNTRYFVFPVEANVQGKKMVKLSEYNAARDAIAQLKKMKNYTMFFEGGYPEVAIFWRDEATGLMMKAKHDYFSTLYSTDYKTTDTLFIPYLMSKVKKYGYNIQAAVYLESRMKIRQALLADQALIYGDVDKDFLKTFINNEYDSFVFVFQKTVQPYAAQINILPEPDIDFGCRMARRALNKYRKCLDKYGHEMWETLDGKIKELSYYDDDLDY